MLLTCIKTCYLKFKLFVDDLEWKPHFFVLTHNKIFYSEVKSQDETDNDEDDAGTGLLRNPHSTSNLILLIMFS